VPLADYRDWYQKLTGQSLRNCPLCGRGHMLLIDTFPVAVLPRARPPDNACSVGRTTASIGEEAWEAIARQVEPAS